MEQRNVNGVDGSVYALGQQWVSQVAVGERVTVDEIETLLDAVENLCAWTHGGCH
jgi:hypothetical protein